MPTLATLPRQIKTHFRARATRFLCGACGVFIVGKVIMVEDAGDDTAFPLCLRCLNDRLAEYNGGAQ